MSARKDGWEYLVEWEYTPNREKPPVRRFSVPGGHIYQVAQIGSRGDGSACVYGWYPPVFVPETR